MSKPVEQPADQRANRRDGVKSPPGAAPDAEHRRKRFQVEKSQKQARRQQVCECGLRYILTVSEELRETD
jgi:hypothetical protein